MNPSDLARGKREKFICGCCSKSVEAVNSDEVIFDYFGREFTEYEYVIENLAIRPAPKKLLDLVPVHSTNISLNDIPKYTADDDDDTSDEERSEFEGKSDEYDSEETT